MALHRQYGQADEADVPIGDVGFVGVDARNAAERIPGGFVASAVNKDFSRGYAETRAGWVTPAWGGVPGLAFDGNYDGTEEGIDFGDSGVAFKPAGLGTVYGASVFSDPNGNESLLVAVKNGVWRLAQSSEPELIQLPYKVKITGPVRMIQAFDRVIMFRGDALTPLVWNPTEDFTTGRGDFEEIADPSTTTGSYDARIPNASDACAFANRLWIPVDRDQVAVSYVLDYTLWDPDMARLRVNAGTDDETVRVFPATSQQLMIFKRRSVYALTGIYGDELAFSVTLDLASDSRGLVGRDALAQIGSKLAWVSDGAIWTATLNDSNKFVFDDQPLSAPIEGLMRRLHWQYAAGICMTAHEERLLVAVPLDGSTENNAILVYNLTTKNWEGYWTADYLRVKAMLQVSENGRKRLAIVNGTGGELTLVWVQEADAETLKQLSAVGNPDAAEGLTDGVILLVGEGKSDFVHGYTSWITDDLLTRGYTLDGLQAARGIRLSVDHETWNPKFDVLMRRGAADSETTVASEVIRGFKRVSLGAQDYINMQMEGTLDNKDPLTFSRPKTYPIPSYVGLDWWTGKIDASLSLVILDGDDFETVLWTYEFYQQYVILDPDSPLTPMLLFTDDPYPPPNENVFVKIVFGFSPISPLLYPSETGAQWRLTAYEKWLPENKVEFTYDAADTAAIMDGSYTGEEYEYSGGIGLISFSLPKAIRRYLNSESPIVIEVLSLDATSGGNQFVMPKTMHAYYYGTNLSGLECVREQKVFRRDVVNWVSGTAPTDIQPAGLDDYAWAIDAGLGKGMTFGKTQRQVESWRVEKRGDLLQVRVRNVKGYSAVHGTRIDTQMGRRAAGSRLA